LFRTGRHAFACALTALALAACGGSDSTPTPAAADDTFSLAAGQTGALLANDRLGDAAATTGNTTLTLTGTLPAGVTLADGVITIGGGAVPGTSTFGYTLCATEDTSRCDSASVSLTVLPPAIVAVDDTASLAPGASADLLANDTLGGVAASGTTVNAAATGTVPAGVSVSATGLLSVAAGTAPGTHSLGYEICQVALPTNCDSGSISLTIIPSGVLSGRALDASTGLGLAGVRVTAAGRNATTDAGGNFTLDGLALADRLPVTFDAPTHGETTRIAAVTEGTNTISARMLPVGSSTTFDAAAGVTATVPASTAQVVLAGGSLQRADGTAASGTLTARLTPIAPAVDSTLMPGDFTTLVGGTPTAIESFGALVVSLNDAEGNALNLRPGSTATVRIALSSRNSNPPATVPLYYFDTATGRWVEEGVATLAGSGSDRYYEGTVTHFSTWNADQAYNTVQVLGCVADATGQRVANATVSSDGVDYSGTSGATTDANGNFTLPIRRSSQATVIGVAGGQFTNTLRVGPYAVDTTLTDCLVLGQAGAGITVKLTWGQAPSDLDSHLFAPNGSHVFYSSKGSLTATPFANLDVDDTSSYGPEVVTLSRLMVGTYRYLVHNYSGHASGPISASGARVELNVPGRDLELFVPPAGETDATDWWTLFELTVDTACNVTVTRLGSYSTTASPTPAGEATYCTP
jgi:uncharacterized protein YfaP (DUF2135 family)